MPQRKTLNRDEFMAEGERLFGSDWMQWQFVCPSCGHVQTPGDFTAIGANPKAAPHSCIGRYDGHMDVAMCSGQSPCNYTANGLFNLCPVTVVDGDRNIRVFDFHRISD